MLSNSRAEWEVLNKPATQMKRQIATEIGNGVELLRDVWNVDLYALQEECEKAIFTRLLMLILDTYEEVNIYGCWRVCCYGSSHG